jgi:hypothetical protein
MCTGQNLFSSNPEVKKEMSGWGLEFAAHLVKVPARQLHPEKIYQKQKNVRTLFIFSY